MYQCQKSTTRNQNKMVQLKMTVQGLEKWGTLNVLGQPANQYAHIIGVITSFHFMVQEAAGVSIQ
jgi:hypothetical protein